MNLERIFEKLGNFGGRFYLRDSWDTSDSIARVPRVPRNSHKNGRKHQHVLTQSTIKVQMGVFLTAGINVKRNGGLSGRKAHKRPISFLGASFGFVVVTSKSDNARSPHFWFESGKILHQLQQFKTVFAFLLSVGKSIDKLMYVCLCFCCFEFGHFFILNKKFILC